MNTKMEKNILLPISIIISSVLLSGSWIYTTGLNAARNVEPNIKSKESTLLPDAVELPVVWGTIGAELVKTGVIDEDKFSAIYKERGAFTGDYQKLLTGQNNGKLKMTQANAGYLLNLFWALGLGNKNQILEGGEMANPAYGGPANFASTGGWTIAKGDPMDHYSRHSFVTLTPAEQLLVDKVSLGIYRPCCGNSTHFPDCNHGMAMLGLLELMASQGVSERDMWKTALAVNTFWFPDNYRTIRTYMKQKGIEWKDVNPQDILGEEYSSAAGYARIASQVISEENEPSGSGCGVDTGEPAPTEKQQSGCGI